MIFLFPLLLFILLVLRFIFLLKNPLYLDEGIYIFWSDLFNNSKDFAYISLQDGKTPLFFWLTALLQGTTKSYLLAGRLISLVAGLVSIFCWVLIFNKLASKRKSLIFLLLALIAPYGFLVERMALSDSLLMAFLNMSLLFLIYSFDLFKKRDNQKSIFYSLIFFVISGILLGLAYATKTTSRLFLITYLLIAIFWISGHLINHKFKKSILLMLGLTLMLLFYREMVSLFRVGGHVYWGSIADKEKLMIYGPSEIIKRLLNNPLSAFSYWKLIFQYIWKYLLGISLFLVIGVTQIIKNKKNRLFVWLLFYWLFVTAVIAVSGKVMASRYVYTTYHVMLAISVFGVDYLLKLNNRKIKVLVVILGLATLFGSMLFVFAPERAIYADDDQDYFVSSGLNTLGLDKVIEYLRDKDKSRIIVGLSGTWGVPEGSLLLLREASIKSEIISINRSISSKALVGGKCDNYYIQKNNLCWKIDFEANSDFNRYLFIVGDDESVQKLLDIGVKLIYKFDRYRGNSKNYFIEIPNHLND